ncbi:hypothetical protein B0H13DRAFT_2469048, partial [Mycena leptocephala]
PYSVEGSLRASSSSADRRTFLHSFVEDRSGGPISFWGYPPKCEIWNPRLVLQRNELPTVAGTLPILCAGRLHLTGFFSLPRHRRSLCWASLFLAHVLHFHFGGLPISEASRACIQRACDFWPHAYRHYVDWWDPREERREGWMHTQNMEGLRQDGFCV